MEVVISKRMKISPELFQAYLKCPTKCWLRAAGEPATGNTFAEWVKTQDETCRVNETARLTGELPNGEVVASPEPETLKSARWLMATNVPVLAQVNSGPAQSCLHAIERVPSEGRGKPAQFIPIRFIYRNKLTKDDKLLLAFDAFVLSESLGREVSLGKIIHGDVCSCARESAAISQAPTTEVPSEPTSAAFSRTQLQPQVLKVKTSALAAEVRKRLDKIAALLANEKPPDLVLNRHCAECEFRDRCRQKAIETDDLSLLAGMSAKERQKLRSKGIFTVTQLSYTFRPRRRPKRLRDKREKYHHSLKALAIREQKIHIVGSPELKIEGTPVYLDVEGLPDRDFYYLIGLRIGHGDSAVQHSLWADTVADEGKIWREFLAILETVEKPVLIHYGSYETSFLKQMAERHGGPQDESVAAKAIASAVNLVSVMFAKIYFPTFSSGLKAIAGWLGFVWGESEPSGLKSILWRSKWESFENSTTRAQLAAYNLEDCQALEVVMNAAALHGSSARAPDLDGVLNDAVSVESLNVLETLWPKFKSPFAEFERVNKAARWDYQRDRIYVRSSRRIRQITRLKNRPRVSIVRTGKAVQHPEPSICPICENKTLRRLGIGTRVLQTLQISKGTLRRRILEYRYTKLWCSKCRVQTGFPTEFWPKSKYGRSLVAYLLYQIVELCTPMKVIAASINRLLNFSLTQAIIHNLKRSAARHYASVHQSILNKLRKGSMVHVDETRVSVKGKSGCVWVLTSLHEVAYVFTETREGEFAKMLLNDFNGVLVSDFFTAYDSITCPQQKCLIHLIRDLNSEVLDQPFDEELKQIVGRFARLLQPMIETVDRRGLKSHFLRKHKKEVERFFRQIGKANWRSEVAIKCKDRLEKNKGSLFTFLDHDGVPWNNNNAEHAIKAFARLRDVVQGSWTASAVQEYLVLLSVCQTCKYMGVDFLDFLRSGEKDIHAFAESRRRRRKLSVHSAPADGVSGTPSSESQPF